MSPRGLLLVGGVLAATLSSGCGGEGEPAADSSGSARQVSSANHDPCMLVTRAEAEAVLGTLVADPYRSRQDTSVADASGPTCVYPAGAGRALLVTPEWTYGKMTLDAERLVGGLVRQVADLPGAVADTLEGPWDDVVVGMSGELLFLKGARSLTIAHQPASTDATSALRLAGPALARLAAVSEPARPAVSADGCPLPPEVVARLLAMPVQLAPRPVRLMDACSYQLVSDPTVEVELAIKPAETAALVFDGLHARAKGMRGAEHPADSLSFGDEGWWYGAGSGSEAAVRIGERLFHANMAHPLGAPAPELGEAMVRVLAAMVAGSAK